MAEDVPLNFEDPAPLAFFRAAQELLSGAAPNLQLVQTSANQLQVPAGVGDAQASVSVGGLFRYVTAPVNCTVSGAAGLYDIFVCISGPNSYTTSVDSTDRTFTLASVPTGDTPTGVYNSRKIATAVWNGTAITAFTQTVGQPSLASLVSGILPAGLGPVPFSGATAPAGWLLCDGSAVAQATYPALFSAIGTTYNTGGEGAGNFRLPDMRGRGVIAPDSMGSTGAAGRITGPNTGGASSGEEKHTLTTPEIPSHNHTLTDPGHNHTLNNPTHTHTITDPGHAHGASSAAHTHTITVSGHSHSITDQAHAHLILNFSTNNPASGPAYSGGAAEWGYGPVGFNAPVFDGVDTGITDGQLTGITGTNSSTPTGSAAATAATVTVNAAGTGIAATNATATAVSANSTVTGVTLAATGGGGAHNNMAPYLVAPGYIIKT